MERQKARPSRTSATPFLTCSGPSQFSRPIWSSGPKSPQFDPSGLFFQRMPVPSSGLSSACRG